MCHPCFTGIHDNLVFTSITHERPKGAEKVYLDFIVNADGSITIRPGEAPITPPVTPPDEQPEIPNLGDSLMVLFLLLIVAAAAMMALASRRRREYTF